MPEGFFPDSVFSMSKAPPSKVARCGQCGLYKGCHTPKMPVTGKGKQGILVVAEAPGKEEDARGVQLVGEAGQLLRKYLRKCGVDLDVDCWKTNACTCRPPNNATPNDKQIEACRPHLLNAIEELEPKTILLLGGTAVSSLIGWLWKEKPEGIGRWVGWQIPSQRLNAWVCPTYHPSYLVRNPKDELLPLFFQRHLEAAVAHKDRPWKEIRDYAKEVKILLNVEEAARWIRKLERRGGSMAVDFECNMLKPGPGSEIVCCGISDGRTTISYPWHGEAIEASRELFWSRNVRKIASNMKYEDRWSKANGVPIRGWVADTMVDAHVLDCRPKIAGLKFQAFVLLGVGNWDDKVKPYLETGKGRGLRKNRIKEVSLPTLLLYNGLDCVYEKEVAVIQSKKTGIVL